MASQSSFSVTVRFTASLPDLSLPIPDPHHTSILSLVCQIREHLPSTHDSLSLRLIHAGRVLAPTASIATALRLPSSSHPSYNASAKAKGKAPVRSPPPPPPQNLYIHASFSDALTAATLNAEKAEAVTLDAALHPTDQSTLDSATQNAPPSGTSAPASPSRDRRPRTGTGDTAGSNPPALSRTDTTTSTMPQGFDRLLAAGLSPLEVASLRSQFVAILAHTHTPDTMPGAAELRTLEERWLDNDTDAGGGARGVQGGAVGGGGGGGGLGEDDTGGLEDMLWGNVMGFFWPIGAVIWLMREEGVWTQRRRVAVVTGALVNLAFSVMRAAS